MKKRVHGTAVIVAMWGSLAMAAPVNVSFSAMGNLYHSGDAGTEGLASSGHVYSAPVMTESGDFMVAKHNKSGRHSTTTLTITPVTADISTGFLLQAQNLQHDLAGTVSATTGNLQLGAGTVSFTRDGAGLMPGIIITGGTQLAGASSAVSGILNISLPTSNLYSGTAIVGSGSLQISGGGPLIVTGGQQYTGGGIVTIEPTTLVSGTLNLGSNSLIWSSGGAVTIRGAILSGTTQLTTSGFKFGMGGFTSSLTSSIPEPGCAGLLAVTSSAMLLRRKRSGTRQETFNESGKNQKK